MNERPLSGVKVLDVSQYVAGPYCTKLLAVLGAEVVKVEKPADGDKARQAGPFPRDEPHPEKSGLFLYLNTNKMGITLNLDCTTGNKIFKELVRDVDILVENFEPHVMPTLGLDYDTLEKINPRLVMTSISNFGQTGPYRDYKATEIVVHALGGEMYTCGDYSREPLKYGAPLSQMLAGANAAACTLVALHCQRAFGFGQHVDTSIMETVTAETLWWQVIYAYQGVVWRRRYKIGGKFGMFGDVFPCQDGHFIPIMIAQDWDTLVNFFDARETLGLPEFTSAAGRAMNSDKLDEGLSK